MDRRRPRHHPRHRRGWIVAPVLVCLLQTVSGGGTLWAETPLVLEGRVTDPLGQPLSARLELLPAHDPAGLAEAQRRDREPRPLVRQRTDPWGHYRVEAPGPGVYGLRVSAPAHLAARHDLGPLVGDRLLETVTLPRRQVMTIEVAGAPGQPAFGLELVARPWSTFWRQLSRQGWWPETRWVVADELGRARLPCADGERLTVIASTLDWILRREVECAPGEVVRLEPNGHWLPAAIDRRAMGFEDRLIGFYRWPLLAFGDSDDDGVFWFPVSDQGGPFPIWLADSLGSFGQPEVGKDEEVPGVLWIELPESAVVEGRIVDATDGRGLAGAWVWLGRGGHLFATTDDQGFFRFRLPLDDEVPLRFAAAGHVSDSGPTPRVAAAQGPLEIALRPQATLRGRLLDPEGGPIVGGSLVLQKVGRPTVSPIRAASDSAGRFELRRVDPASEYELLATARGFRLLEERVRMEGWPIDFVLEPARRIHGRVLDESEKPLEGATVELFEALQGIGTADRPPDTGVYRAITDRGGVFELFDVLPALYFLAARTTGYPELAVPGVEITPGDEAVDLGTVVLSPGVILRGRVVDGDGRGVAGARLSVRRADGAELVMRRDDSPWFANRRSETDGRFTLETIPRDSRLILLVSARDHLPWQDEVEVGTSDLDLDIELERAVSIRGLVLGDDGGPLLARVEALALVEEWSAETRGRARDLGLERRVVGSEADGSFEIGPLVTGRYELRARAGEQGSAGQRVDVGPEGVDGLVLRLASLSRLTGQGFGPGGEGVGERPLVGGQVKIVAESGVLGVPGLHATDTEGRFSISALLPGVYRLSLLHRDHQEGPVERIVLEGPEVDGIRLRAGEPLRPRSRVAGWVVDAEGRGVAGARIHLMTHPPSWGRSEDDGSFELEGRVGEVRLQAHHPEHGAVLGEIFALGPAGRSGIRLELASTRAVLRGRVVGLELDTLARVSLLAQGAFDRVHGALDWQGGFRFDELEPGVWTLEARLGDEGRLIQHSLVLEPGEIREGIELVFTPGHRIRGTALHRGKPLTEGDVMVRCEDGARAHGRVGPGGHFEIPDISEGSCVLRLETDLGIAEQSLEVVGEVETWIEVEN